MFWGGDAAISLSERASNRIQRGCGGALERSRKFFCAVFEEERDLGTIFVSCEGRMGEIGGEGKEDPVHN